MSSFVLNLKILFTSKKVSNDSFIYLLLYVDDMIIMEKNLSEINELKALLNGESKMKDLGEIKKIHDMEIHKNWSMVIIFVLR